MTATPPTADAGRPLDTRTALLLACRDNPEEDTPRLQLADYLDGEADPAWVKCRLCIGGGVNGTSSHICKHCGGRGEVNHNAEWAELIRNQIAVNSTLFSERHRFRERDLTAALGSRLSARCPGCGGEGGWSGGPTCPACEGSGDLLRLTLRADGARPHRFDRGCLYFDVTLGEVAVEVENRVQVYPRDSYGPAEYETVRGWRPTPWAAALPPDVVGLWVTDREPSEHRTGNTPPSYSWWDYGFRDDLSTIPSDVLSIMRAAGGYVFESPGRLAYPTPHLARLHLAHALRRFAAGGVP